MRLLRGGLARRQLRARGPSLTLPLLSSHCKLRQFSGSATNPPSPSASTAKEDLPTQARVVIAGGGIIGTSIAYHLAKQGWKDVLLLERDQLTSGTTWHAAGLMVTFGSLSETSTELRKYSKELYSTILQEETGMETGFMPVGFIELATDEGYLEEYRRVSAFNRKCGIDVHEISPAEVERLFPLCRVDDVLAGFYVPTDGRVNPVDATAAMARAARQRGATIVEGVAVSSVDVENGAVRGVTTSDGASIACEYFVNAAGMWARQLGAQNGVAVANQAAEHYYLLTEPMGDVGREWPVVEDPSSCTYIRPEGGGLMVGLFETDAASWAVDGVPHDFSFGEIEPDWDRLAPFLERAMGRVPRSLEVGAKKLFCGPESFTPDLSPIVGPAPEVKNYFVCAGLNSIGILTGGGIGKLLAEWIVDGSSQYDVTGMVPARLQHYQCTPSYRKQRVVESLGKVYKCHYPNRMVETARDVKRSPLHARLQERGAFFRDVSGWEGADWYEEQQRHTPPSNGELTWGRPAWFDRWEAEHKACREACALIDMSFMSKFLVQGRDAGAVLDRLATAKVDGAEGVITYTQCLSERGSLEADLTMTKLPSSNPLSSAASSASSSSSFLVVATDTAHRHVESLLSRGVGDDDFACVTDVSGGLAQINLQGPLARTILAALTSVDVSDEAFPFRACKTLDIGCASVLATRITYVGELGYELFIPSEMAVHVYDEIVQKGEPLGLKHAGLRALGSLRMEKGYRDYGHDLDNVDTLLEAGLGFTADYDKPKGFVGLEATRAQKAQGVGSLSRRLVQVLVDDPLPMLHHGEVVYRNGEAVADIRSASYGHTLGGAVGLAMVELGRHEQGGGGITAGWIKEGAWEVDIAGTRYPARASLRPLYDPRNERIKM